jgi:hypothetical protein
MIFRILHKGKQRMTYSATFHARMLSSIQPRRILRKFAFTRVNRG